MNITLWVYVRLPEGGFCALSRKAFEAFHFRGGALTRRFADEAGYVRLAELTVATAAGVPFRVVRAGFHKVRLAADGTRDPAHADLELSRVAIKLNAFALEGGWRPTGDNEAAAEAAATSARFEERRSDLACEWEPTDQDREQLHAIIDARMDGRSRSRRRHVEALLALPLSERLALAADRGASAWKLSALAQAREPAVRAAVAANRGAPQEVLESLCEDVADEVAVALAGNYNTDEAWLERRAKHEQAVVRAAVALNARTPFYVVERLAWADRHPAVRKAAQSSVDRDLEWATRAASSEHASMAALRRAAVDRRREVRLAALKNPRSTSEIITILAADSDPELRALAQSALGQPRPAQERR